MSEPNEDLRRALREAADELGKGMESMNKFVRDMGDELAKGARGAGPLAGRSAKTKGPAERTPADTIRDLAALRDEGHISAEEFEAKKADVLARI